MKTDVWWYNSSKVFDTPRALIYYHIPKCAGGSIVYWMLRHNPMISLKLDYTRSHLFYGLHYDPWKGNFPRPDWKKTRVAVEYHYYSMKAYIENIVPVLNKLRKKYILLNGSLTTFTTVRNPISVIKSWYMMWPPRTHHKKYLAPFEEWSKTSGIGLIARSLVPQYKYANEISYKKCIDVLLPLSIKTLDTFDFVLYENSIANGTRNICKRMDWSRCPSVPRLRELGPLRKETLGEVKKASISLLKNVTFCDYTIIKTFSSLHSHKFPFRRTIMPIVKM